MSPRPDERLGPEFSRPFPVARLGEDEVSERIEASETERAALARRLGLLAVDRLVAVLRISRPEAGAETGAMVALSGRFEADVTQACVVSLAPLRRQVARDFKTLYQPPAADAEAAGSVELHGVGDDAGAFDAGDLDPAAADPPEPLTSGELDLGEAVVQQLAVALDPYPRAEGATLEALEWDGMAGDAAAPRSPFQELETLTRGR